MKSIMNLVGILLIVFGIVCLGYQGISYTKREKVAEIGDVQVTADTQKTIYLSPVAGAISLVAGIFLVALNRRK